MNAIKKLLGFVWMILAPTVIVLLVWGAWRNIGNGTKDIHQPVPWVIVIGIFTPIAIGLFIFGWYCVRGEYSKLPMSSAEI
jgi:purine-cytosine permease-like protein